MKVQRFPLKVGILTFERKNVAENFPIFGRIFLQTTVYVISHVFSLSKKAS